MAIQDFSRTLTTDGSGNSATTFTVPAGFRAIFKAFAVGTTDCTIKIDSYEVASLYRPQASAVTSGTPVEWGEAGPFRASAGQVVSIASVGAFVRKAGINGMLESI
jgi:hypothetical protein